MTANLRPVSADDRPFLCQLYASTREDELAPVDWPAGQKAAFLASQFEGQHRYYAENYTDTSFDVIVCDGVPVGRFYVARWADEIRIVDIALLPEFCGRGLGSTLIQELLAEAARLNKPIRIHVERFNRALNLYQRLGFVPVEDKGVYLLLEHSPPIPITNA